MLLLVFFFFFLFQNLYKSKYNFSLLSACFFTKTKLLIIYLTIIREQLLGSNLVIKQLLQILLALTWSVMHFQTRMGNLWLIF